jgi:hypothetical protein
MKKSLAGPALLTSTALYTVSFFLPVVDGPRRPVPGYAAFLMALIYPLWYSVFALAAMEPRAIVVLVLLFLSWLANVVYWEAIHRLLTGHRRGVSALGILAVLLGLCVLPFSRGFPPRVFREGYWVWLGGMALLAFGGGAFEGKRSSRAKAEEAAQRRDD